MRTRTPHTQGDGPSLGRRLLPAVALLVAAGSLAACSTENTPVAEKAAVAEALDWLHWVDRDSLAVAWERGAPALHAERTRESWIEDVTRARRPLGPVVDRTVRAARYEDDPEGYEPGVYVITTFETEFGEAGAIEEMIVMRLVEDVWRPARYVIATEI